MANPTFFSYPHVFIQIQCERPQLLRNRFWELGIDESDFRPCAHAKHI